MDPEFPLHLWDQTSPHAEMTLNLLRGSRLNPKLFAYEQIAYEQIHGRYDFNRNPIAPPGMLCLAHEQSSNRKTWAPHAQDGWCVGPAMESHQCHRVYIPKTRGTRIVDTVTWLPHKFTLPVATTMDLINASLQDLAQALKRHKNEESLPSMPSAQVQASHNLAEVLSNNDKQATPNSPAEETTIEQPLEIQRKVRFHPDTQETQNKHRQSHAKHPARELRVEAKEPAVIPAPELRVETPTAEPGTAPHIILDDNSSTTTFSHPR